MAGVQEVLAERYELLEVLGRGGMGVVYRARDRVLDRVVAVKVLPLERAHDPTLVARFEREALAVARLSHRNIVAVFDSGTDGETRFFVMEYIAGRSLAQLLREDGPPAVDQTRRIGAEVADALAVAHAAGIVHRDIKPANVMLDAHGRVKVLDFGIARLATDVSLTQTAMVLGSAAYLAPELIGGARADAASDIYALGCVLYELLAGLPPFTGELAAAILHQHNNSAPESLRALRPEVPPALDALIMRMLAKDAGARPRDAREVQRALAVASMASGAAAAPRPRGAAPAAPLPRRAAATEAPTVPLARRAGAREAATTVMPRAPRPIRGAGRALGVVALLVVVGAIVAVIATAGGPSPGSAAHRHRTRTRTGALGDARTVAGKGATGKGATSRRATTKRASAPQTAAAALSGLSSLVNRDLRAGSVSQPAANAILGDVQGLLAAGQRGQLGPALAGLAKLGADITGAAAQGGISSSALPALNTAVAHVESALERSLGSAITTPTAPAQGHGGHQPPGQAGKHQGHGQGSQGDGQQGEGDS